MLDHDFRITAGRIQVPTVQDGNPYVGFVQPHDTASDIAADEDGQFGDPGTQGLEAVPGGQVADLSLVLACDRQGRSWDWLIGYSAPYNENWEVRDNVVVDSHVQIKNYRKVLESDNFVLRKDEPRREMGWEANIRECEVTSARTLR